jgi:peptidoglycan/LPS O-acetylase OafA/YrhL
LLLTDRIYTVPQALLLAPVFFLVIAGNNFGGLLSSRPMRALGQISYSIYIFHGILLFDLLTLWTRLQPIATMGRTSYAVLIWSVGIIVVLFSTLSYWFIERVFTARTPKSYAPLPAEQVAN